MSQEQGGNNVPHSNGKEERIYVAIRVRPLNEKEKTRQDVSEWECVSHNTIKFKNNGHAEQRSSPDTYTFDRVFGEKCPTKQVYEQGIKEVALSVIRGINSSIFTYGQTSSGKTYTMTGITELAVNDIYEYIEKHKEREFIVKFSALEIYNEAVRDLLNSNATTLRLLDDPEKGTIVEKLTEETLTERSRLQQLISKCAAERTTEETAMNETSSRSHQILRLTLESNPSDFVGTARSGALFASVNFVDLAGSERASQALSAGTRLREGSHINRSLLTLGTVIRKLCKERNGHIPYRDSKLTRILHNSLGGNARTAIICTISPARSQIEQSKNTLFFAGCAKQVTTNARVNVVMSDKVLVKQLQKELARMENELKSLNTIILKEREHQIEQKDKEIKELTRQRDLFQNLFQSVGKDEVLKVEQDWASEWSGVSNDPSPVTDVIYENLDRTTSDSSISNEHLFKQHENCEDNFLLDGCPPTFLGPDPCQGWEEMASRSESKDSCKEALCIEIKEEETEHKTNTNISIPAFKESEGNSTPVFEESEGNSPMIQFVEEDGKSSIENGRSDQDAPRQKVEDIIKTNNHLVKLTEKSNDPFESKPCCVAAMSHPPHVEHTSYTGNGHSDQDASQQKPNDIKRTNNHLVNLTEKFKDSFESEACCMVVMSPPQVEHKSSTGNGHSDQDASQQKTEDIKRTRNHLVNLTDTSNDPFESEPCSMAVMSPPQVECKYSTSNGHSDQDAPHQKHDDIKRTNNHLVNLTEKFNDSFESESCYMVVMSPSQVERKSSTWNGHSDQDVSQQKTEDIKRTNNHLVNLTYKSNDSFEYEPCFMTVMSPPQVECKNFTGNGHSDQDAPHQKTEDIKRTNNHLVNLIKKYNDLFESKTCCMAPMSPPQVERKSFTGNEYSDQNSPQQKNEDIKKTNDHLVNLAEKFNDSFESEPCCITTLSPRKVECKSNTGKRHNGRDAPQQNIEDIKRTNNHLVNLTEKSNDSFEFEPCCMDAMSPPQVDRKYSTGNGHSDQDAPQQKIEDIKTTHDHLVNLEEKSKDSFEAEPRCMASMSPPQVDHKYSTGNGHCDQDVPQQKIEDIETTHDHLVNLEEKSKDSFEAEPRLLASMSPPQVDGKSFIGNEHSDQDAPHQKNEDIKRTNDQLVNLSKKSNDSFESESSCMAVMPLLQVDDKSFIGNGHNDQDAPQQKVEDIKRTNDHLVNLSEKSNDLFESEPRCMADMSPPQVDKVNEENPPHPQFLHKLDQEPTSPHQFDQEDLKTISPPQLDDMEQVSFNSPASAEKEYSTSLICFPEKQSEPKLRAKRRKTSKKSSLVREMNASMEDVESVMDSDLEETSSVLSFVVRMNEPVVKDIDNRMVAARTPPINKNVNRVKGLSFPGVWGTLIPSKFEMQQRDIVELWDACNVPLVHRSYFFLLIKGELSDSVYLDLELRRLSFLKDTFSSGNHITGVEDLDVTPNSSLMSLTRERKMLSKQMHKKFSRKGREELYLKWGIDLKTKHRSIQLAWLIWTDTRDLNHIRESAALVAKLVGFINTGETSKKTFGFGFLTRRKSKNSLSWKDTMSTL